MILLIQLSQFIILEIQLSQLSIMFWVQVVVQWENIFQLSQNISRSFNCLIISKQSICLTFSKQSKAKAMKQSICLTNDKEVHLTHYILSIHLSHGFPRSLSVSYGQRSIQLTIKIRFWYMSFVSKRLSKIFAALAGEERRDFRFDIFKK